MKAASDATSMSSEVLNLAEKSLYDIAENSTDKGFVSLERITRANMTAIEQIHSNAGRLVTGLPTGYDRFNEMTSGFQPGDLIRKLRERREIVGDFELSVIARYGAIPRDRTTASLELFAKEVLPELHRW
jgi:replicative DNA helicase